MISVGHLPFWEPTIAASIVANANQRAMPSIVLQSQPQLLQIPLVALEDGQEVRTREQEHARDMVAFVFVPRPRTDVVQVRRRQRR